MTTTGFEAIREQVSHATNVQRSAIQLIQGLADKIDELSTHPNEQELHELADELRAQAETLATAIAAHEGKGQQHEEPPGEGETEE